MSIKKSFRTIRADFKDATQVLKIDLCYPESIGPRNAILVVDSFDEHGSSVMSDCRGVIFSKGLQVMYAYLPPQIAGQFNRIADLEFSKPVFSVELKVLSWPDANDLAGHLPLHLLLQYTKLNRENGNMQKRTLSIMEKGSL